jgi:hypothetical protein
MKFYDPEQERVAKRGNATCGVCRQELGHIIDETGVEYRPAFLVQDSRGLAHIVCRAHIPTDH